MPVETPTPRDIEARLIFRLAGELIPLTDLTPIAVLRQLVHAWVEEFHSLWRGLTESQRQWYIQSATGDDLDRRLADFGIEGRPGGTAAYGLATITAAGGAVVVTPGTILRTNPTDGSPVKRYSVKTNENPDAFLYGDAGDGTWNVPEDTSRQIEVVAAETGEIGNTSAGTITVAENPIENAITISNLPITNGQEPYGDEQMRAYFISYIQSLSGGTRWAIGFKLSQFETVDGRRVNSFALAEWGGEQLISSMNQMVALLVYVDEGISTANTGEAVASQVLVNAVQAFLDGGDSQDDPGVRAAGVPTSVEAAKAFLIPMDLDLDVDATYTLSAVQRQVEAAIHAHIVKVPVSGTLITGERQGQVSFARLFKAVVDVEGVLAVRFRNPTDDVAIPLGFKAVVGTLTVRAEAVT